jgi:hypothetical protein
MSTFIVSFSVAVILVAVCAASGPAFRAAFKPVTVLDRVLGIIALCALCTAFIVGAGVVADSCHGPQSLLIEEK